MAKKIIDILKNTKKTLFSFELLPPLKGKSIESIYQTIDPLMEFNPLYVNVTYHQEEVVYKKRKDKLLEKSVVRKRPGTVAISAAIKYKYKVKVIPHIICGGFTREETEYALIDLNFLGIDNILVVRGDPAPEQKNFIPEPEGHSNALGLVKQVANLNRGKYLDAGNMTATDFSMGVAGYPEKHPESPNRDSDFYFLKKKVEAGADFIVTQMFFDNKNFFEFVRQCRNRGINAPIIPGLKPLVTKNHLNYLPKTFGIDLPESLVKEVLKCKTPEAVKQVGIEWAIAQSRELIEFGVPVVHYFTLGKAGSIQDIAKEVF